MANPVRPDADIVDADGRITPRWNSYLSWLEGTVIAARTSGTTAQRPTKNLYIGQFYYDTTLNYPVYVRTISPVVWRNGAGAVV